MAFRTTEEGESVGTQHHSGSALMLPDPGQPVPPMIGVPQPDRSHGARRAALRSIVCAAARRIVKQDGVAALTLRRISLDTGVSSQTLYNNFGPRDHIILGALTEYDGAMIEATRRVVPGIEGILVLEEGYMSCILRECAYTQEAIRFIFAPDRDILGSILRHGPKPFLQWLVDLRATGHLRRDIDIDALGRHMAWIHVSALYEWAALGARPDQVRDQLMFRSRVTLIGAASEAGRQAIADCGDRPLAWQ
jgi:AcrR family transcriptional regulator